MGFGCDDGSVMMDDGCCMRDTAISRHKYRLPDRFPPVAPRVPRSGSFQSRMNVLLGPEARRQKLQDRDTRYICNHDPTGLISDWLR